MRAIAILALLLSGCRPAAPPPAIDARLAERVPQDATAIAGFRPSAMHGLTPTLPDARYVLIAAADSAFVTMTLDADGKVNGGQPAGRGGRSALLAEAEKLAASYPAWAVLRGGTALPFPGTLANVNNLLRDAQMMTITARMDDQVAVDLRATCGSPESASHLEGSLRAVLLLTKLTGSSQVQRDGSTVHASIAAPMEAAGRLIR